jgi:hypothetical protein
MKWLGKADVLATKPCMLSDVVWVDVWARSWVASAGLMAPRLVPWSVLLVNDKGWGGAAHVAFTTGVMLICVLVALFL